jgi:hypothetical protein
MVKMLSRQYSGLPYYNRGISRQNVLDILEEFENGDAFLVDCVPPQ